MTGGIDKRKVRRRRHDAKATREQILTAAQRLFGSGGYGDVSLRQIAAEVGLDAAMIIRHFGSKDNLFAEAMQRPDLLFNQLGDIPRAAFGDQIVRYMLGLGGASREMHMLVALLRSATHKQAATRLPGIAEGVTTMLARWLGGQDAELRAGLIWSQLIGILIMRGIFANDALTAPDVDEDIVERVAPVIQALVDS